jgi:hypothetical protein
MLKEIGMKNVYVVKEQELPDGNFPTVPVPNPEDPRAFELALKMQQELGADLCVGTDPDCDRVGIACMTERPQAAQRQPDRLHTAALHTLPEEGAGRAARQRRRRHHHRVHRHGQGHLRQLWREDDRGADRLQVHRRADPAVRGHRQQHLHVRL